MNELVVEWTPLEALARRLAEPGVEPGSAPEEEWRPVAQALEAIVAAGEWPAVIRLRELFTPLLARDTVWGLELMQRLDKEAIAAARRMNDQGELAHLLGARGHNLHRQGYHREAIQLFEESAAIYQEMDASFPSLKSRYMTALCFRALGDRRRARQVLAEILSQVDPADPWRGNPLQVMAWLSRDDGQLTEAERLLEEALYLQEQTQNPDILVVGTLADLGEVLGLQGRIAEAREFFQQSLAILQIHGGQYDRQEARTRLKYAELLTRAGEYDQALRLLNEADDQVRAYGHYYDLMWRIELARAQIYFRQRQFIPMLRKLRAARRFRQELGLPTFLLVKPLLGRWTRAKPLHLIPLRRPPG
ncbi:MAG: tetratricopeptide repeat protein [Chloroflexi bacterium]|nr:tetratricopeptide repeat protein [Chloroflexota bacterium]MCI0728550.1 tetratricopeptide repeat protein [Chloroflexota bacterium]